MQHVGKLLAFVFFVYVQVEEIQAIPRCWNNLKPYEKHEGYYKTDCVYCECVGWFSWHCEDKCSTEPPTAPPKSSLPVCPETKVISNPIISASRRKLLRCHSGMRVRNGDYVVYDLGEKVTIDSVMFTDKGGVFGDGLKKFSISFSNFNYNYELFETIDLNMYFRKVILRRKYLVRFIKFTILDSSAPFCPKFEISGCKAPTCVSCQNPTLCTLKPVDCSLKKFCSKRAFCKCKEGYKLDKDMKTCIDIDECNIHGYCPGNCQNTPGSFTCNCGKGYRLSADKTKCIDIDECKEDKPCSDHCRNTVGSFTCSCNDGYKLGADQRTCEDIDECTGVQKKCPQICLNSPGSFSCKCFKGYTQNRDNVTCTDINECATSNGGCDQDCFNQPGSFYCSCRTGYVMNKITNKCEDVDECKNGPCSDICQNTIGSFRCLCKEGYRLKFDVRCEDIDECANSTLNKCDSVSTTCLNFPGTYSCSCRKNFLRKDNYTCSAVKCPAIVDLSSTEINPSDCKTSNTKMAGDICSVSCAQGYVTDVKTPVNLTCKANGFWDGNMPQCKVVTCPPLSAIKDGSFFDATCLTARKDYQTKCTVNCNPGYDLKGDAVFECSSNGAWTNKQAPTCEKIIQAPQITCGPDVTVVLKKGEATYDVTSLLKAPTVKNANQSAVVRTPAGFDPTKAPYGRTLLRYTVKNKAGQNYCEVVVVVEDKESPTVTGCPQSISVKSGVSSKAVSWTEPKFNDNVKILRVDQTWKSGSLFPEGKTTVEYKALDLAKNSVTCKFDVTVTKIECKAPKIRNGTLSCQTFNGLLICRQQCNSGLVPYVFFGVSLCRNAELGFSVPIKDCVPFFTRKATTDKCPAGSVPQVSGDALKCVQCPIGTYQDGDAKCSDCPVGKSTTKVGGANVKDCQ